ncbi:MAG: AAA family ATPase [Deltaproteobacteria bacterium]|nr:AAA family ATPase [Deltaproteobacteria bacterium]
MAPSPVFIRHIELLRERIADPNAYPFSLPALRKLDKLKLDPHITFFIGENGSGKSTLIEAIAVAAGMNPEGGSRNMHFATRESQSSLHTALRLVRGYKRPRTDFFLRAESFYNVATAVDGYLATRSYGGKSLHEQSHGESFMAMANHRLGPNGLYIFDEPEAALSPQRQLALLARIHALVQARSQFIIATHSPILMAYPGALLYSLSERGIEQVEYEQTEHFALTRDFLLDRERYLRRIFER